MQGDLQRLTTGIGTGDLCDGLGMVVARKDDERCATGRNTELSLNLLTAFELGKPRNLVREEISKLPVPLSLVRPPAACAGKGP